MHDVDAPVGSGPRGAGTPARGGRPPWRIWTTPKAAGLHVTLVVVVPVFLGLFWWQVQRVRQGNTLSWAYVFEWPFFTGYAVYLWWKLIHDQLDDPATPRARPGWHRVLGAGASHPASDPVGEGLGAARGPIAASSAATAAHDAEAAAGEGPAGAGAGTAPDEDAEEDEEDEELAAYNRYLAELNASGRPKRW